MTKRKQFKYDFHRIMVSLALRPTNWEFNYPYQLENAKEQMAVWVANGPSFVHFEIGERSWGKNEFRKLFFVVLIGWLTPWRRKLYLRGWQTGKSQWVYKYGREWDLQIEMKNMEEHFAKLNTYFKGLFQ